MARRGCDRRSSGSSRNGWPRACPRWSSTLRRGVHPVARGCEPVQGALRIPRLPLHLDQRRGGPRHPVEPTGFSRGRHHLDRCRGKARMAGAPTRPGPSRSGRFRRRRTLLEVTRDALDRAWRRPSPGGISATSATRWSGRGGIRIRDHPGPRRARHGRKVHEDPQVPNMGTPGRGPSCGKAWSSPSSR
jgi:hypothetical protein